MKSICPKYLFAAVSLVAVGALCSCRFMALEDKSTPPLEQLEISNTDISNWKQQEKMAIYIGTDLFNLNDGGAPQYLDKGCIKTGHQVLNKSDGSGASVESMVMDFGTEANATAMFQEMQMNYIGKTVADQIFPDTVVGVTTLLGGVKGFAHIANFYFEMSVTGFYDQLLAQKTFDMFLGLYAKKLNL
jgi:hypothetical protein